ncbi:hypothetical protein OIDMADRAFT_104515 [Oidiodendron maius Zn]|uniref:Thymidylate kinase n=1 Tax=Oidiodendron maius (strain Zn) TaxID=913774 RepID=A0A0C3GTT0_OIDMZ|nr:hypothetical protein OIDMADRAFT_104515 [Oidiodendron maius Zn]
MAMTMAATRQPFGPVDSSRLQTLTSLKNRQNALSTPSAIKRKAASFEDDDDAENVDPVIFLSPKRSKCPDGSSKDSFVKPVNYFLTPKAPASTSSAEICSPRRSILPARSPLPKLSTSSITKSSPLSAPAGRSPTRKRVGILNRRRTASPFTRIDPPKFSSSSTGGLGFSIDAALSGTIPSYAARHRREKEVPVSVHQAEVKDSWFFDIHEDTPDEEATNLMEHSTCTLDISSDEESAARMRDERGKENVPPLDDVSQTRGSVVSEPTGTSGADHKTRSSRRRRDLDAGAIEIDRSPLGEMPAEDFYAEGCDEESIVIVPGEEGDDAESALEQDAEPVEIAPMTFDFCVEGKQDVDVSEEMVDALMRKSEWDVAPKAALLDPLEKAEEGFQVWESGSAKGEGDE